MKSCQEAASPDPSASLDDAVDRAHESMTMMGLLEVENQSPSHSSADSSASNFINRIKNFISLHATERSLITPPQKPRRPLAPRRSNKSHNSRDDYVLPPRRRADYLLASYWQRTVYPFVDADEVEALYPKLWTGDDIGEGRQAFLCLINMIFSVACLSDPNAAPSERAENAELYYQRAREYLDIEFINSRSRLAVQCFLLLGEYLQSRNEPQWCWTFVGLSIRIAQSLGLDSPATSEGAPSAHEREKMRRIWHSCVVMDRGLEMTFGRPAMITPQAASSVPYPSAHIGNDPCTCFDETSTPDPSKPSYHFFIEALKLYEVMGEIWMVLYNPASGEQSSDDTFAEYFGCVGAKAVGTTMEMHAKLCSLSQELPMYLRYSADSVKATRHQRHTNILWLRHRYILLLLFRPVLARFCNPNKTAQSTTDGSLPWKIALQCSVSCVETALETIDFLDRIISNKELSELDDLLPGWWYSILYIYSAAAVLLAARLHPTIVSDISERAIVDGWQRVMKILKRFASLNRYAATCAESLNRLFKKVRQQHSDVQRPPSQQRVATETSSAQPPEQARYDHVQNGISSMPTLELYPAESHFQPPIVNAANLEPAAPHTNREAIGAELLPSSWSDPPFGMGEDVDVPTDYYSGFDSVDRSDDMSWLTAFPFQLYEQGPAFGTQVEE